MQGHHDDECAAGSEHSTLGDNEAEFQNVTVDLGRAPACILFRHPSDELSNLLGELRPNAARAGTPPTVQAEAGTVSGDDSLWLDDDQDVLPTRPETAQSAPEEAVEEVQGRTRSLTFQHTILLSECDDFEGGIASTAEEDTDHREDGEDELLHEPTVVTWRNRVPDLQSILRASC